MCSQQSLKEFLINDNNKYFYFLILGRSSNSLHSTVEVNPTSYRFSSVYIKILRNIQYKDHNGELYCFDVQWSCSVPTYIEVKYLRQ